MAFAVVDRMLGGTGGGAPPNRALTEIEQNVIDSVVQSAARRACPKPGKAITPIAFTIRGRETRPQMLQVSGPNEVVVMLAFDVRIGSARGMMNLCLPATLIEAAGAQFAHSRHRQRREPNDVERMWIRDSLARVPMDVTALLQARLRTSELMELAPGDVLSLGIRAEAPIEMRVGETPKYQGRLTRQAGRVGVRIERRLDPGAAEA